MNALVIAPRREVLCKRCACVRVRMRAGEVLGMSAGEERSALVGEAGQIQRRFLFFVVVVRVLSSSGVKLFGI